MELQSIGELARRTGLTVKTIRFWSDQGLVPPADRSSAGYRRYGTDAVARLELVRTLRDLGLDLATIRRVVDRELTLPEVAAAHADALAVQIQALRLRRAVLTVVAARGSTPEEMDVMHDLATLSEAERRRLITDFLKAAFGGVAAVPGDSGASADSAVSGASGADGAFEGFMRSMTPELPADPDAAQLTAWIELAELSRDPDFRACIRRIAEHHAADRAAGGFVCRRDPVAAVRDIAGPASAAGVFPASRAASPTVDAVLVDYAQALGGSAPTGLDDATLRDRLLSRLEAANDPRREQYERLLSVINGWPVPASLTPVLDWTIQALRARVTAAQAAA